MKVCLFLTLPAILVFTGCASRDSDRPDNVALKRRETRVFDDASPVSENPNSPLNSVVRQQGRVGMNVRNF